MSEELFPNATIPRTRPPTHPHESKTRCILCNKEQFVFATDHKCDARDRNCVIVVTRKDGN